jgi:hypothetical protein
MLGNIAIAIRAHGPAAVLIVWMLCFTALAIWGVGDKAGYAQGVLASFGVLLLFSLAQKVE